VLRIIYSDEVAAHAHVLIWLAAGATILWTRGSLGTALDAMRRFAIQPWIHLASTVVIAGACVVLIPDHGLVGAAAAVLIGYVLEAILFFVAVAIPLFSDDRTVR
jgi:O-antigen/teichoic acid export membrane protein